MDENNKIRKPNVYVLILSYNGRDLLEEAIPSYLANDYAEFQVVVIDNGSIDNTCDYVASKYPTVKLLRTDVNLGYSGGLNFGMRYAFDECNADYALITNNDVKADTRLISELVEVAERNEKTGFAIGKVYYYDNPNVLQTVGRRSHPIRWSHGSLGRNEVDNGQYDENAEREFCDDIYWLVNHDLYKLTGGYDENFFLQAEDYEWQARAKQFGYKIQYTPKAKLWHKVSMTIGKQSALKAYYDFRNPMLVILLHRSPQFFKRYFWDFFQHSLVKSSLRNCLKFKFDVALSQWRGFFSALAWGIKNHRFTWRHFI